MIITKDGSSHQSYHFLTQNFGDDFLSNHLQLEGIGKVLRVPAHQYYYNGMDRPDINNSLFQYTLSGTGTIRIGNTCAKLPPGHVFMVSIPGDHEYYLDPADEKWEFYYIMFHGDWAKYLFEQITGNIGVIFPLDGNSRAMQIVENMYDNVTQRKVEDMFETSALAYMLLMELCRLSSGVIPEQYPPLVRRAVEIIRNECRTLDGIGALAAELSVSRAHLIRVFSRFVGVSPGKYLIRARLEHAAVLLKSNDCSLNEVARKVGFANGNYLGKVLRRYLNISTQEYRRKQSITPFRQR